MKSGNLFNKYESKNFLVKILMRNFFNTLDSFLDETSNIKSVLEIGCGEGYIIKHIKNHPKLKDAYIEGADIDTNIIKKAKMLNPEVIFTRQDIYNLTYKKNSFDLVLAIEVFEHLRNPEKALIQIKNVSKKYLLISVPREPFFRIANLMRLKYVPRLGNTPGHVQSWTKNKFRDFLNKYIKNIKTKTAILWTIALCDLHKNLNA